MVGLLNMENIEGTLERTPRSTHYVSMWYVPGGHDYLHARPAVLFFSNVNTANAFAKKWEAAPEHAMVGTIEDYDRIRSRCESVYKSD